MTLKGPTEWPYLASLCGGYLHQDFAAEHGSASKAVQAWLADANGDDAMALSSEWRTFLNVTHGMDVDARARVAARPHGRLVGARERRGVRGRLGVADERVASLGRARSPTAPPSIAAGWDTRPYRYGVLRGEMSAFGKGWAFEPAGLRRFCWPPRRG